MSRQYGLRLDEHDAAILERLASGNDLTPSEYIRKQLRSVSPKFKGEVKHVGYPKGRKRRTEVSLAERVELASKKNEGYFS